MDWASSEWMQDLPPAAVQKIQEFEEQLQRLQKERQQKIFKIDSLEQTLQNQKLKLEEEKSESALLTREVQRLEELCKTWECKQQKVQNEVQIRDSKINHLEAQLEQLKTNLTTVHQLESDVNHQRALLENALSKNEELELSLKNKEDINLDLQQQLSSLKSQLDTFTSTPVTSENEQEQLESSLLKQKIVEQQNIIDDLKQQIHGKDVLKANETTTESDVLPTVGVHASEDNTFWCKFESQSTGDMRKTIRVKSDSMLLTPCKAPDEQMVLLEQRLKQINGEFECFRYNAEATKAQLEQKFKETEKELKEEIKQQAQSIADLDSQLRETSAKFQQELAQSCKELDMARSQLDKVEKTKLELEEEMKQLQSQDSTKENILKLEKSKKALELEIESLKSQNEEMRKLTENCEEKTAETAEVKFMCNETNSMEYIHDLERKVQSLEQELLEVKRTAENKCNTLSALEEELLNLNKEYENKSSLVHDLQEEKNLLDEKVQLLEHQLDEANANMEIKIGALSAVEEDMVTLKTEHEKKILVISELEQQNKEIMERINLLEEKVRISEQEILQLQDVIKDKSMTLSSTENDLVLMKTENEEKSLMINEMNNQISGLQDQVEHFKKEISEIETHLKLKTNDIEEMTKKLLSLEKANTEKTLTCENLEKQFEKLNCEHTDLELNYNEKNQVLGSLKEELSAVKSALEQESLVNQNLKESNTELDLQLTTMQETVCVFEKQVSSLELELKERNEMILSLKEELISMSSAYEQQQMVNQQLKDSNTELGIQLTTIQETAHTFEKQISSVELELKERNEMISSLKEELVSVSNAYEQQQMINQQLKDSNTELGIELTTMQETVCTFEKQISSVELELKERNEMITSLKEELVSVSNAYEQQLMASNELQKNIENLTDKIEKLQLELDEKNSIIAHQENEGKKAKEVIEKSALDNEEIKNLNIELNNQLCSQQEKYEELEKQIFALNTTIEEKSGAVLKLTEEVASLQAQLKQKVEQCEKLDEENKLLLCDMSEISETISALKKDMSAVKEAFQKESLANTQLIDTNVVLDSQLKTAQEKICKLELQIKKGNSDVQEKDEVIASLNQQVEELRNTSGQQVKSLEELQASKDAVKNEKQLLENQIQILQRDIMNLNSEIGEKVICLNSSEKELSTLKEENKKQSQLNEQLQQYIQELNDKVNHFQTELDQKELILLAFENQNTSIKEILEEQTNKQKMENEKFNNLRSQFETLEMQIQASENDVKKKDLAILSFEKSITVLELTTEQQLTVNKMLKSCLLELHDKLKTMEEIAQKCIKNNEILEKSVEERNDIIVTLEEEILSMKIVSEQQAAVNAKFQTNERKLLQQLNTQKQKINILENEISLLSKDLAFKDSNLCSVQEELSVYKEDYEKMSSTNQQLNCSVTELSLQLQVTDEQIRESESQLDEKNTMIKNLLTEVSTLSNVNDQYEKDYFHLYSQRVKLMKQNGELQNVIDEKNRKLTILENEILSMNAVLENELLAKCQKEAEIIDLKVEIEDLKIKLQDASIKIGQMETMAIDYQNLKLALLKKFPIYEKEICSLVGEELQKFIAEKDNEDCIICYESLCTKNGELRSQLEKLENICSSKDSALCSTKMELNQCMSDVENMKTLNDSQKFIIASLTEDLRNAVELLNTKEKTIQKVTDSINLQTFMLTETESQLKSVKEELALQKETSCMLKKDLSDAKFQFHEYILQVEHVISELKLAKSDLVVYYDIVQNLKEQLREKQLALDKLSSSLADVRHLAEINAKKFKLEVSTETKSADEIKYLLLLMEALNVASAKCVDDLQKAEHSISVAEEHSELLLNNIRKQDLALSEKEAAVQKLCNQVNAEQYTVHILTQSFHDNHLQSIEHEKFTTKLKEDMQVCIMEIQSMAHKMKRLKKHLRRSKQRSKKMQISSLKLKKKMQLLLKHKIKLQKSLKRQKAAFSQTQSFCLNLLQMLDGKLKDTCSLPLKHVLCYTFSSFPDVFFNNIASLKTVNETPHSEALYSCSNLALVPVQRNALIGRTSNPSFMNNDCVEAKIIEYVYHVFTEIENLLSHKREHNYLREEATYWRLKCELFASELREAKKNLLQVQTFNSELLSAIDSLTLELENLNVQKKASEEIINNKICSEDQMKEEKKYLEEEIVVLESKLKIKEEAFIEMNENFQQLMQDLTLVKTEKERLKIQANEHAEIISKLNIQLSDKERTCFEMNEAVQKLEQNISQLKEEAENMKSTFLAQETIQNEAMSKINDELEAKEEICRKLNEMIFELKLNLLQMNEEQKCLKTALQLEQNETISKLTDELCIKGQECTEIKRTVEELKLKLQEVKEENESLEIKLQVQTTEQSEVITKLTGQIKVQEESCSDMNERILELKQSLSQIEEEKCCLKAKLETQENEIATLNKQKQAKEQVCFEMSEKILKLEQSLNQIEKEKRCLETKLGTQENEIATINDQKKAKEQACSEMSEKILKLEQNLSQIEKEKRCLEKKLEIQENDTVTLNDEKQAKEQVCSEMSRRILELEQRLSQIEEEKQCLETKLETQENKITTLNDQKEANEQMCSEMSEKILKLKQSLNQIEKEKHCLKTKLEVQENETVTLNEQKQAKEQDCSELNARILKLEQSLSRIEEEKRCLETKLETQENKIAALNDQKQAKEQAYSEMSEKNLKLEQSLSQIEEEKHYLETKFETQENEIATLTNEKQAKEQAYSEMSEKNLKLEQILSQIEEEKRCSEIKLETLENEIATINEQKEAKEQACSEMSEKILKLEQNLIQMEEEKRCLGTKIQSQENAVAAMNNQNKTKEQICSEMSEKILELEQNLSQLEEIKRCLETKLKVQEDEQNETLYKLNEELKAEKQACLKLNEIVLTAEQNLQELGDKNSCLETEFQVLKGKQDEVALRLTGQLEAKEQLYLEKCKMVQELEETLQEMKETKISLEIKLETQEHEKCTSLNELTVELKAREQAYLKMSEVVSQLELNLQHLNEEKQHLETKVQVQENEQKYIVTKLSDQLEAKEEECEKLRQTVQDLEQNLQETNIKNKELHAEVQHVNEGLKKLQAVIAENKETLYTPAQYKSVESKAELYREKAASLEAENLNMLKLIELTEAIIQKEMKALSFPDTSFKSLHDFPIVMNTLYEEITHHRSEIKAVKSDIDSKHETIIMLEKSLKESLDKMSTESDLLTEKTYESDSLRVKLNDSENQLQSCFKELKAKENEIIEWKAKHAMSEKSVSELEKKLVTVEAANTMLNSTIDEVEENLQEVFREKQQIQDKLDKIVTDHATTKHLLQNKDLTLKSDIQEIKQLVAKYCDSFHTFSGQIQETKEQMKQLYHNTVKTLIEQSKNTRNLMHKQELPLKENLDLIESQKRSTEELQNLNNEIKHALKLAKERIVDLENEKHELLEQVKNITENESNISSLNIVCETLKKEVLDWRTKFDDLMMTVNEGKTKVACQAPAISCDTKTSTTDLQDNLLLQISELKNQLEVVEREKAVLESQLSVLRYNSDEMKETEKRLKSEIDKLQNDLVLYQQKIRDQDILILKQSQSVETVKDVKRENEALLATKSSLFEKIKKLDSELIRMESEHRSLQNDLDMLKLENRTLVSENECLISVNSDLKIRIELNENIDTTLKKEQEFSSENSDVKEDGCTKSNEAFGKKSPNSSLDSTSVHAKSVPAAEEISSEKELLFKQRSLLEQFFKSAIKIFNFVAFFEDDYAIIHKKDTRSSTLKSIDILNDSKREPQDTVKSDECMEYFTAELQNLPSLVDHLMKNFAPNEISEISFQNLTKDDDPYALFKQFHACMSSLHSSLQTFKNICDKRNEQFLLTMQKLQTDSTKHSSDSTKIQELEDELKKLKLDKQALEGKMSIFKSQSYRLEKCYLSLQKEHSELQEKIQKEKSNASLEKKESPELEQKVQTLSEELEETKAKLEKYETDLFNVYAAQSETQKKYDTSRRECQTLRAHLQYLQNKQREKTDCKNMKANISPLAQKSSDKQDSANNTLCEATNKENCLPTK